MASLVLVLSALVFQALLVGPASVARVPTAAHPWDGDDRREWEQGQRTMIRSLERGWTWAIMPPGQYGQDNGGFNHDDPDGWYRLVDVTALGVTASGEALVGGEVRGQVPLGSVQVARTQARRGFVGAVVTRGGFRMVHLGERENSTAPSALAVDRASRIVAGYEDGTLTLMTPGGRVLWSTKLPPARALAFAPNGDILATGCTRTRRRVSSQQSKNTWSVTDEWDGYVARVSAGRGGIVWSYRFDRTDERFFDRPLDSFFYRMDGRGVQDCGWGIAVGPDGDAFVTGTYVQEYAPGRPPDPSLPERGSFLARFTNDGRVRWSRLIATSSRDPIGLALGKGPRGPIVVAGRVVKDEGWDAGSGLAAFDLDGTPRWTLPIQRIGAPPHGSDDGIQSLAVAVAAGKAMRTPGGFFFAGLRSAPMQLGHAMLAPKEAGIFLARIDEGGDVVWLDEVRPGSKGRAASGAGDAVVSLKLSVSSRAGVWLAGTMRADTSGAWAQWVPSQ